MAVFGDTLQQARAQKGVSLKEAEMATKISRHHLLALEEEQFHDLPPLIYQRGIVKNYATYLNLDPAKVLTMFAAARGVRPEEIPVMAPMQPLDMPNHWAPNFAIIAFLVVMGAVLFAWMYSAYFSPNQVASTPTEIIPTVTRVNSDTLFMPSPAIVPPTPTPTVRATLAPPPTPAATATTIAIVEPTSTVSAPAIQDPSVDSVAVQPTTSSSEGADVIEPTTEPAPTVDASGQLSLNFVALSDISSLSIVVDGSEAFNGALASGDSTGFIPGAKYEVAVNDPSSLQIQKENGESFSMGNKYFERP